MKLGARVFKTAVAIVFALFIAELLKLPSPVFAGIAAIFAIQPSIYRSYQTIVEQIQANIIGATIAVIFGVLFGHHLVAIGIAVVVTIGLMLKFKLEKSLSIALVTVVAVMEIQGDDFITFGFIRFSTVLVGVLAAFVINLFFLPPKYEVKLFRKIHFLQDDIIRWTRLAVRQASEHTSTKAALGKFQSRMSRVDMLYEFYKEERSYFKNKKYEKARKLVVYRQMITTSKKSLELLHRLHRHENELAVLPPQFHLLIQERLDFLLTYHEQLLLKYTGKLKPEHSEWTNHIDYIQRNQLMDIFIKQVKFTQEEGETEFSSYHLLYILSRILDYEENLEHLDMLIVSFQSYHGEEINLEIEEEII
ncbi:aromatic acid exporter family protein [Lysinibacillus sp. NPDC097287]|uniref:FUSC family protein n=1 Tax=Lysinibacillus sp. NPDC097287 TaxID=3364144 RepID=UPI00380843E5